MLIHILRLWRSHRHNAFFGCGQRLREGIGQACNAALQILVKSTRNRSKMNSWHSCRQLMAVDSSCQAVLEVQAQDLICLSPCQSGEDCLGLTAKTPRPDLLLLGFPQIPLPSDSIGMSRDQVKWLCVYLALCLNSWKCLSALLCCPVLGALTSPLNIINVAQVFILFRLSFGDGEPVMFDGRHEALAVAKQRGLSQELQLFQRLSKWPSCVTACKKETGKIEKHSRGRRSI